MHFLTSLELFSHEWFQSRVKISSKIPGYGRKCYRMKVTTSHRKIPADLQVGDDDIIQQNVSIV